MEKNGRIDPASWFAELCEGGRQWPEDAPGRRKEAKADKPKDYEPAATLQEFLPRCRTFDSGLSATIQQNTPGRCADIAIAFSCQKAQLGSIHEALRRRNRN